MRSHVGCVYVTVLILNKEGIQLVMFPGSLCKAVCLPFSLWLDGGVMDNFLPVLLLRNRHYMDGLAADFAAPHSQHNILQYFSGNTDGGKGFGYLHLAHVV